MYSKCMIDPFTQKLRYVCGSNIYETFGPCDDFALIMDKGCKFGQLKLDSAEVTND